MSRLPRFVFRGRTAVITGAASGIGEQVAHALARRGTTLVLLDRDAERLRAVASEVRFLNSEVDVGTIVIDLADAPALDLVAEGVRATHPRIDLLVNNAGVALAGLFQQTTLEEFEWLVDVNLRAPVRLTHHLLPALLAAANAHVVNVSSVFGIVAPPGPDGLQHEQVRAAGLQRGAAVGAASARDRRDDGPSGRHSDGDRPQRAERLGRPGGGHRGGSRRLRPCDADPSGTGG